MVGFVLAGGFSLLVSFLLVPGNFQYVRLSFEAGEYDYARSLLGPRLQNPDPPLWVLREAAPCGRPPGLPEEAAAYLETLLRRSPEEHQDRLERARLYLEFYGPDPDCSQGGIGWVSPTSILPEEEEGRHRSSQTLLPPVQERPSPREVDFVYDGCESRDRVVLSRFPVFASCRLKRGGKGILITTGPDDQLSLNHLTPGVLYRRVRK